MSQELLYTSAPKGLKPGSRGFCTVLSTQGMPAPLAAAVEGLSGYRAIYPPTDERASRNPVVYSHLKMQAAGRNWHVLSRIADYGLDYSQRPNKLAHHVIVDRPSERLPGGPANLLSMPGFMRDGWEGEPKIVAPKPITREPQIPQGVCQNWKDMTGDAGWAGVLAESFLEDPDRLVIILFTPGEEILPLFAESLSLLPIESRWDVTFSTYFTSLTTGTTCTWRAMIRDSKEAHESLRFVNALRIDLNADELQDATGGALVTAARTGRTLPAARIPAIASSDSQNRSHRSDSASSEDETYGYAIRPPSLPAASRGETEIPEPQSQDEIPPEAPSSSRNRWPLFGAGLFATVVALLAFQFAIPKNRKPVDLTSSASQADTSSLTQPSPSLSTVDDNSPAPMDPPVKPDAVAKQAAADGGANGPPGPQLNPHIEGQPPLDDPQFVTQIPTAISEPTAASRAENGLQISYRKLEEAKALPMHSFHWKGAQVPGYERIYELSPSRQIHSGTLGPAIAAGHQNRNPSDVLNQFRADFGALPPACRLYTPPWVPWTLKKAAKSIKQRSLIDIVYADVGSVGPLGTIDLLIREGGFFEYVLKWKGQDQASSLDWCAIEIAQPEESLRSHIFFAQPVASPDNGSQIKSAVIKWSTHHSYLEKAIDSLRIDRLRVELPHGAELKSYRCEPSIWTAASSNTLFRECSLQIDGLNEFIEKSVGFQPMTAVHPTLVLSAKNEGDRLQLSIKTLHLFGKDGIIDPFEQRLEARKRELFGVDLSLCEELRTKVTSVRDKLFANKFADADFKNFETEVTDYLDKGLQTQITEAQNKRPGRDEAATGLIEKELRALRDLEKKLRDLPIAASRLRNQHESLAAIKSELDHLQISEFQVSYDLNEATSDSQQPHIKAMVVNFNRIKGDDESAGKGGQQ